MKPNERGQGPETEEKRKEERGKGKGPRLNSLRSSSLKNLTGQAGIGPGIRDSRFRVQGFKVQGSGFPDKSGSTLRYDRQTGRVQGSGFKVQEAGPARRCFVGGSGIRSI
jgi:hypothetical protein